MVKQLRALAKETARRKRLVADQVRQADSEGRREGKQVSPKPRWIAHMGIAIL